MPILRQVSHTIIYRMPRKAKQVLLLLVDTVFIYVSIWGGFVIVEWVGKPSHIQDVAWSLPFAISISIPLFAHAGFYRAIIHQASDRFFLTLIYNSVLSVILLAVIVEVLSPVHIPGMVWVVHGWILLLLVGGIRWFIRYFLQTQYSRTKNRIPVAIYGAGDTSDQIIMALEKSPDLEPVAIFDDKSDRHGMAIRELTVSPSIEMLHTIKKLDIKRVLLSLPEASRYRRQQIINFLESMSIHVQDIPDLKSLADGSKTVVEIREISNEDLLGRTPVPPNRELLTANISGKSVLVTGAGGSIGSELCRQIVKLEPKCLVLVEQTEFTLYSITKELLITNESQPVLGAFPA